MSVYGSWGALGGIGGYSTIANQQAASQMNDREWLRLRGEQLRASIYVNQAACMAGLYGALMAGGAPAKPRRRSIHQRWRSRMLRIEEKQWQRRKLVLTEAAYRVGLVWAGIAALVITIWLCELLLRAVVG